MFKALVAKSKEMEEEIVNLEDQQKGRSEDDESKKEEEPKEEEQTERLGGAPILDKKLLDALGKVGRKDTRVDLHVFQS